MGRLWARYFPEVYLFLGELLFMFFFFISGELLFLEAFISGGLLFLGIIIWGGGSYSWGGAFISVGLFH